MKRASPDARWYPAHYTGGDVEKERDFALHSVGAFPQVTSRCVIPFFGWQVSQCVVVLTPDK
ncbi:hypothetical protein FQN60_000546 [Etheostoma spectabile]|uniref:Uncharacterized protein n=1 Tax=Etheostoma spectabile TaxID=54343 RepID=A0A5J5D1I8_9PERO|nr:hypothetical protein FQN60_000546 [Etheostoma spectabile]